MLSTISSQESLSVSMTKSIDSRSVSVICLISSTLSPAGTSRLICEALEENMVRLLQMTVLDQIAYAVLATTTHSPTRTHAAAMTWQAGRILPARR